MRAPRCHRSLKRDEEITLWRSLCALGAPLYGNLCISFSPFLSASLSLSFSFSFSLLIFLPVFLARPNGSLHSSSFFLVHLARSRDSFYHLPLFLCALSSASVSSSSLTHSFARSLGEAYTSRHFSYSVVPSSVLSPPHLSSPRSTLFSPLSFSPPSISLSRGCPLIYSHPTLSRTSTFAPLFSLLVCFPLPVGNCTLSLLPSRRFPLVRICHCSSIRFRVFCLPPPPFLLPLVLRPLPRPVSLCLLSTLVVPSILPTAARFFTTGSLSRVPARATKRRRSRSPRHRRSPQAGLRI